uniref:Uncharacterized protein n=2 Tax=Panagrolaimus sp. PS1159 TaxID=55785 RepID=A0AC35FRW0_9BILA
MANHREVFEKDVLKEIESRQDIKDFDEYVKCMKEPNIVGDLTVIQAISSMLQCNIYLTGKYGQPFIDKSLSNFIVIFYTKKDRFQFGTKKNWTPLNHTFGNHRTGGLKNSLHGNMYQLKLLLLFLKRGLKYHQNFCLATEDTDAAKFDDIQYIHTDAKGNEIREADGKIHIQFLQAKHAQISRKITYTELSRKIKESAKDDFCLAKYYKSYKDIKRHEKFRRYYLEKFYICTNIPLDLIEEGNRYYIECKNKQENGSLMRINVVLLNDEDIFFDVEKLKGTVKRYKLNIDESSDIFKQLTNATTLQLLAENIAGHFSILKKLDGTNENFKKFQTALFKEKIIKVIKGDGKKTYYYLMLTDEFITNNPELCPEAKMFRTMFFDAYKKQCKSVYDETWEKLRTRKLNTSNSVGEKWIDYQKAHDKEGTENNAEIDEIKQKCAKENEEDEFYLPLTEEGEKLEVKGFLQQLIFVITPDEKKIGKIIASELGEQYSLCDTDFVANHLFGYVMDWMKQPIGLYLHDTEVDALFTSITAKISKLMLAGVSKDYRTKLQNMLFKSTFEQSLYDKVQYFLESPSVQLLLLDETMPLLSAAKISEMLQKKIIEMDNVIIVPTESAFAMKNEILSVIQAENSRNILAVIDDSEYEEENLFELCTSIFKAAKNNEKKKFIFISNKSDFIKKIDDLSNHFEILKLETWKKEEFNQKIKIEIFEDENVIMDLINFLIDRVMLQEETS